jgi:hypothetical protein
MEPGRCRHDAVRPLGAWVRGALVGMAVALVGVFFVASRLNPYHADGTPLRMETHRQLLLPPCTFKVATGLPCPSCGMTTSFALLVRGDVVNSLRANAVGTLLAVFWLGLIPWALASAVVRRPLGVQSLERTCTVFVLVLLGSLVLRWVLVVGWAWWSGRPLD